ncbi:MAG TPA: hypothetical protein VGI99_15710, partial [Gemmataceae bacterium]
MSILRIKVCLLTAACIGLIGLTGSNASAFGGKLFGNRNNCNSCDTCGGSTGAGGAGAGGASGNVQWVPTWVEETVNVMKPTQVTETYTAYRWECVPQTVTKQVMVNKRVTETVTVNKMVTERVPVQKQVTVNERVPVQK